MSQELQVLAPELLTARPALPRVNLLPPEIAQARRFRRVQSGLVGAVVASGLVVGLLYAAAAGGVSDAHGKVDAAAQDQRSLTATAGKYHDVTATYTRASDAQALLTAAMGTEVRYSTFLEALTRTVPDGVWLKDLSYTQDAPGAPAAAPAAGALPGSAPTGIGKITVSGVAFEHDQVADWLDALAAQQGYGAPLLTTSGETLLGTRTVVNWTTTVTLTPQAESGRYAKTDG